MSNCYIYFYDGHLSVSPTTISIAQAMGKVFDNVVVFTKDTSFDRFQFEENNVKAVYMNDYFMFNRKIGRLRFFIGVLKYLIKNKTTKNDMFICIDDRPLTYVDRIRKWFNIPFVFLSLELFTDKKYSKKQKQAFRNSKAILIQDDQRLKTLLKTYGDENNSAKQEIFSAPNVSTTNDKKHLDLENMVQQFDNLPQDKTICASIGMISDFVFSKEISKAFSKIDNAVLIYHDRGKINKNNSYVQEVIEANENHNLFLSGKVYDFADIAYVYEPIHIGIAMYQAPSEKYDFIGHASGKLTFYLKYKKPVIVNRLDGFSDIIEKYDCGVIIEDINNVQEWQNAIDKINSNYEYYSNNSHRCYMEEFDFNTKIQPFCEFAKKLTHQN